MRASPRSSLQRLSEDLLDFLVADASRSPAAGCISQRLDLLASITAAPLTNGGQRDSFTAGDLGLLNPSEAPKMILPRSASRWLDLGRLAINVSFSLSAGLRTIVATGLPIGISLCKPHDAVLQCISLKTLGHPSKIPLQKMHTDCPKQLPRKLWPKARV